MTDSQPTSSGGNGEKIRDIVIRLDERTARMESDMKTLRDTVVTQTEFKPIRAVVYGLVALVLTSVFAGLLAMVLNQQ